MANLIDLYTNVGAYLIGDDSSPSFTIENTSTGTVLNLKGLGAGTAIINAVASAGTISILALNGLNMGYVSTNSTASIAYAMRVKVGSSAAEYWMPIYTGKA